jgi:hypothetical protein
VHLSGPGLFFVKKLFIIASVLLLITDLGGLYTLGSILAGHMDLGIYQFLRIFQFVRI